MITKEAVKQYTDVVFDVTMEVDMLMIEYAEVWGLSVYTAVNAFSFDGPTLYIDCGDQSFTFNTSLLHLPSDARIAFFKKEKMMDAHRECLAAQKIADEKIDALHDQIVELQGQLEIEIEKRSHIWDKDWERL